MAAHLIEPAEIISVTALPLVVFGPPGVGKTALAQTLSNPITLDFDQGSHRAFNRKRVLRLDAWSDLNDPLVQEKITEAREVVVDTIGRALDLMSVEIIKESAKNGTRAGGLTLQGYGVLKARFASWLGVLRAEGKDVVMLCHEREEKDGDDRYYRPDIQGGSYAEVHKLSDLIAYLSIDRQGNRTLDFTPTDRHLGKDAAGFGCVRLPRFEEKPQFLADLLANAKFKIGKTAEASSAQAKIVDQWVTYLATTPELPSFNEEVKAIGDLTGAAKKQVWALVSRHAEGRGWAFQKATKEFVVPEGVTAS